MHREGRNGDGSGSAIDRGDDNHVAMFNHICAGIGSDLSHGERSRREAVRVRGLCVSTVVRNPSPNPLPMGEGHAVLPEAAYASPPPFAAISAFNLA